MLPLLWNAPGHQICSSVRLHERERVFNDCRVVPSPHLGLSAVQMLHKWWHNLHKGHCYGASLVVKSDGKQVKVHRSKSWGHLLCVIFLFFNWEGIICSKYVFHQLKKGPNSIGQHLIKIARHSFITAYSVGEINVRYIFLHLLVIFLWGHISVTAALSLRCVYVIARGYSVFNALTTEWLPSLNQVLIPLMTKT